MKKELMKSKEVKELMKCTDAVCPMDIESLYTSFMLAFERQCQDGIQDKCKKLDQVKRLKKRTYKSLMTITKLSL